MRNNIFAFLTILISSVCQFSAYSQGTFDEYGFLNNGAYVKSGKSSPNSYAVILNGGCRKNCNYSQYWNNCAQTYQFLTQVYGFNKDHIYTIIADGMDKGGETVIYKDTVTKAIRHDSKLTWETQMEWNKDAKKYEEYRYYYADGSQLFRNRLGVNRIYTAVLDSIEYVFNRIKNTKNIDELFVFVTDHGYEGSKDIAIWNGTVLSHTKFAKMVNNVQSSKKTILLAQCFSGSFIEHLKEFDNRTICTATSADSSSWGSNLSCFFRPFYSALYGKDFDTNSKIDADYDKNGVVSYEEAFVYAKDNDGNSKPTAKNETWYEVPRYWTSESGYRFCRPDDWGVRNLTDPITQSKTEEAMYLLNASNVIKNKAKVTYSCGKTIRLKKGFHVINGSKFKTEIFDCEKEKQENEAELRLGQIPIVDDLLTDEEFEDESSDKDSNSVPVIAPNPTTGEFTIYFSKESEEGNTVVITDITGKLIYSAEEIGSEININLRDKAKGVYIVKTISNGNVHTEKLILK